MANTVYQRTDRFSGACDKCIYPIVRETEAPGDTLKVQCPGCGAPVTLERLYGSYSDHNCDPSCQHAIGSICVCSCGGANHQRGYIPLVPNGEVPANVLSKYRQRVERYRAAAQKRAATKAANKAETLAALKNDFEAENPDVLAWCRAEGSEFAIDLLRYFDKNGYLTLPQILAVEKAIKRDAQRRDWQAKRDAEVKAPAPEGRVTVQGEVVSIKTKPGFDGGDDFKMTTKVTTDEGVYLVWSSVPKALFSGLIHDVSGRNGFVDSFEWNRGTVVRFTATLTRGDDEHFAFGKRPSKAEVLREVNQ